MLAEAPKTYSCRFAYLLKCNRPKIAEASPCSMSMIMCLLILGVLLLGSCSCVVFLETLGLVTILDSGNKIFFYMGMQPVPFAKETL